MMELVPYKANFQKNLEYPMEIYEAHARKSDTPTLVTI